MKKIIKSISLLSAIILLTGCEESYAGFTLPNGQDIINKLIPNIPAFLVQLTAFILMAVVVIKFAYKPVAKFIKARQDFVSEQLKSAKEKEAIAEDNLQKSNEAIKNSRVEASAIIEKAKADALKTREEIITKIDDEVALRRKQAEEDILRERKQAEEEIKEDIIDVALVASSAHLKREVSDDDNKKFLDEFITSLDKE